jgi:OPT oligopeptide transporter protein
VLKISATDICFIGSVRALGETDLNPVSGLGKISQLLFAVIQPGNIVANIIAGGVAEAGAQQCVIFQFLLLTELETSQSW